ncbi:hypothetical protein QVD17_20455 [Tagetes erecta]|uniref:Uncharacterized protein n=1 Tax=Tagetes erecta TaxID=13708 RepID=A0AAD8KSV7_TARER|nr:hypothetical protein QVD17_20455 [Tagetes erecta]
MACGGDGDGDGDGGVIVNRGRVLETGAMKHESNELCNPCAPVCILQVPGGLRLDSSRPCSSGNVKVDREFGPHINRNDYFAVAPLKVLSDSFDISGVANDFGGGGRTEQTSEWVSYNDYFGGGVMHELNAEMSSGVVVASDQKSTEGEEGDIAPRWWKKCCLKLTPG